LICKSKNGFIQAALQLLSQNKQFVRYFLSGMYIKDLKDFKDKKHFSMILDNLFTQMWRPTAQIENDRQIVDISDFRYKFKG
jgi:hypothetical protein